MIEILKAIGSALITAAVTLTALWLKRKWDLSDRNENQKKTTDDRLDDITERMHAFGDKIDKLESAVDKLSRDLDKETIDTDLKNRCLQAGLREMLYDRIKYLCRKYQADGQIREEDYKSIKRMWSVYHEDLKGNGFLDEEMAKVEKLDKV